MSGPNHSSPENLLSVSSSLHAIEDPSSSANIPQSQSHHHQQQHHPFASIYAANINADAVLSPTAVPLSSFQPQSAFPSNYNIPSQQFHPPPQLEPSVNLNQSFSHQQHQQQQQQQQQHQQQQQQQHQPLFGQMQSQQPPLIPTPILAQGNRTSVLPLGSIPSNVPSPFQQMPQQIPQQMPQQIPQQIPQQMPQQIPQMPQQPQQIPQQPQQIPQQPQQIPQQPQQVPQQVPQQIQPLPQQPQQIQPPPQQPQQPNQQSFPQHQHPHNPYMMSAPYPLSTPVDPTGKRLPNYYQPSPLSSFEHAPQPPTTAYELRGLTPAPMNGDVPVYNYSASNPINNKNPQQYSASNHNLNRGNPVPMPMASNIDENNGIGAIADQQNSSSALASTSASALAIASAPSSAPASISASASASASGGPSRLTGQYSATDYNKLVNNNNNNNNNNSHMSFPDPSNQSSAPSIPNSNQPMFNTPIFNQEKIPPNQQFSSMQPVTSQEIPSSRPPIIQAGAIPAVPQALQQYTHMELQEPHNSLSSSAGNESISGISAPGSGSGSGSNPESVQGSLSGNSGLPTNPTIPSGTGLVRANPGSLNSNLAPMTHELSISSASYPPASNMMYNNANYGGLNSASVPSTSRPANYPMGYNEATSIPHSHLTPEQPLAQQEYEAHKKKRRHTATMYDMTPETAARNRCPVCGKQFKRPSSLQTHLYSHTGEKLFKCPWPHCGRHFSVKSNMTRHTRLHERDTFKDNQENQENQQHRDELG